MTYRLPLTSRAVHIGRAPDNDLVLTDDLVSWHHTTLWVDQGRVWVRDRGSRNGTYVNEVPVRDVAHLPDGGTLRLGARATLVLQGAPDPSPSTPSPTYLLEDLSVGVRHHIPPEGLQIGGPEAQVPLGAHDVGQAVLRQTGAALQLMVGDIQVAIEPGVDFGIGGHRFRVVPAHHLQVMTADQQSLRYRLNVTLDGPGGPEATLVDPTTGHTHRLQGETRAVMFYVLAKRLVEDRAAGLGQDDAGWVADDDLSVAIWGRDILRGDGNALHVLQSRVRRELRAANLNPELLEKRRKLTRLVLSDVTLR